jgi:60 kDa SS-A/Ro ribonucleoprotein
VIDALDGAFYATFSVEPAAWRWLLALDVSGSMGGGTMAGVPGYPRIAAARWRWYGGHRRLTILAFSAPGNGKYGGHSAAATLA